jgi:small subunit ribosomal protein S6
VYTTVRNYEALYIVDATLTDEQLDPIIAKYSQVISDQGGEVQAAGKWDKRRLAYEVKGRREGTYILMYFLGEPAAADELDRVMRISDDVMRHLITRVEPQHVDTTRIEQPAPTPESAVEQPEAPLEITEGAPAAEAAASEAAEEAPAEEEAAPTEEPAQESAEEVKAEEEPAAE